MMWLPIFLLWPLVLVGTSSGISWLVSLSVLAFWEGVLFYPACSIFLAVDLFWLTNSGYTGSYSWLPFSIYFVVAVADFVISLIYSRKASDWYAQEFQDDTVVVKTEPSGNIVSNPQDTVFTDPAAASVSPVTVTPATVMPASTTSATVTPATAATAKTASTVAATDKPYLVTSFKKEYTDYFSL